MHCTSQVVEGRSRRSRVYKKLVAGLCNEVVNTRWNLFQIGLQVFGETLGWMWVLSRQNSCLNTKPRAQIEPTSSSRITSHLTTVPCCGFRPLQPHTVWSNAQEHRPLPFQVVLYRAPFGNAPCPMDNCRGCWKHQVSVSPDDGAHTGIQESRWQGKGADTHCTGSEKPAAPRYPPLLAEGTLAERRPALMEPACLTLFNLYHVAPAHCLHKVSPAPQISMLDS